MNKQILKQVSFSLFLVLLGTFISAIGSEFIFLKSMPDVYKHTEIVTTGYLGIIVGFALVALGMYNVFASKHKKDRFSEKPGKITLLRKRKKVVILIDIGLIFLFAGLILWVLVCLGVLGRVEDLFTYSNIYANIGTLFFGFGVILSGIGIAIEIFLQSASKKGF
jgi:multisubunit Na+/H+ antiporter MnhG subunit